MRPSKLFFFAAAAAAAAALAAAAAPVVIHSLSVQKANKSNVRNLGFRV